ncbi:unnamed protein product [Spirodela intermedia]|uniref:Transmembrane 9 superfamily member n=1 Tax=Spirodela intermedia TaxID=51605 RepID=A0ABN7EAH5_SPIIN|nr:unnamed protein product [Spirodela intermedia]
MYPSVGFHPLLALLPSLLLVVVSAFRVGPDYNRQETYNYYSLPFCQPAENPAHKWAGLGEVLGGNELIDSQIKINYRSTRFSICTIELDAAKVKQFEDAIDNLYWLELFMDDLPLQGYVGEVRASKRNEEKYYLYTHKDIVIKYNGDQIIHVNLTQGGAKHLEVGKGLDMTYSVKWIETDIHLQSALMFTWTIPFFEHQNPLVLDFQFVYDGHLPHGLVSMILMRTLRNDYAKYAREEEDLETLERDVSDESGWKLVHGDVFRPPFGLALLSALVVQVLSLLCLFSSRGTIVTTFIVCYALTSFSSGYVSGGLYSRNGGTDLHTWIKTMILTASLFPFSCFGIGFILNTVAIFYGSLAAIPFGTMVVMLIIWAFVSFPLRSSAPLWKELERCPGQSLRVKTILAPSHRKKWYLTPSVISLMGGLLPFGSIFIEMYFVSLRFGATRSTTCMGSCFLVFLILLIVTICVTINYHWQWTSFSSAASTSAYAYLYSIYYYHAKTRMSGLFQISFYFWLHADFCWAWESSAVSPFLRCGYLGSSLFVRRIYRNIKCD